jgi:hypothetical protein
MWAIMGRVVNLRGDRAYGGCSVSTGSARERRDLPMEVAVLDTERPQALLDPRS